RRSASSWPWPTPPAPAPSSASDSPYPSPRPSREAAVGLPSSEDSFMSGQQPNGHRSRPGKPTNPMEQVLSEVKKTIVGQAHLLERMLVALLSRGHMLVEGVPGLAKTLAVKSLAAAIGGQFHRVQFTPDLVPADLIGTRMYHQRTGEFEVSL